MSAVLRGLTVLVFVTLLAGCQDGGVVAGVAPVPAVDADAPAAEAAPGPEALSFGEPAGPLAEAVPAQKIPDLLAPERAACERRGGRFGLAFGKASYACYQQTRDANRPCSVASDCDGLCLARSRTCSPVKPFFGCHEVLTGGGVRTTLCIE